MSDAATFPRRTGWLWAEFLFLYLLVPLAVALFLPPTALFPALFALTVLGMVLLHLTPGFRWRELLARGQGVDWRLVTAFAAVTAVAAIAVVLATRPPALFFLPRSQPGMMLMILLLYPFLSALPQEVLFRPLFFRRYGALLPGGNAAILFNALFFSLAHLMFWSWIVAVMTFAGGLAFAWAYLRRGSFAMAVILHAVAGWILFAAGLGMFFYSGNVERPF